MGSRRFLRLLTPLLVLGLVSALGSRAAWAGDTFVDRVNAKFTKVPKDKRSDLIILPLLAKLEAPPAEVATLMKAQLIMPTSPGWEAAADWAKGKAQQDLLKGLAEVTKEEDFHIAMVFAQGYGIDEVADAPDLLAARMYTELGDPPTLATAKFGYLKKMEEMQLLANVETTRLAAEGNVVGALETLIHLMFFARQMADRPMVQEKRFGMVVIRASLERARDVIYQDLRAEKHLLDYKFLRKFVERSADQKENLGINRIGPPTGTFIAAEQILTRVLIEKGGVNNDTFAEVLARVGAQGRPLRLFSESAYWDAIRPFHEGWYTSMDMLKGPNGDAGLQHDWEKRFFMDPNDIFVRSPSDYKRYVAQGSRFAALRAVLDGVEELMPLKHALRAEISGTRLSAAVYGYTRAHHDSFPPLLTSIRPDFISVIDPDPYSASKAPIEFFVPIRDNIPKQNPRRPAIPLNVNCFPGRPNKSFLIPLREDTFVIYSVGPDGSNGGLKDATQADPELEGDYIFWPPMISLIRKHLIDTGELK